MNKRFWDVLYSYVDGVDYLAGYAGEYPLREKPANPGYTEDRIRTVDEKLKETSILRMQPVNVEF